MLESIEVLCHASIKFTKEKTIYFDPFKIAKEYHDADIIFVTHSHYDHFSEKDILKVKRQNTKIVITQDLYERTKKLGFQEKNIIKVIPNETYQIDSILVKTIPAYNTNKQFHPKENNWVGYLIKFDDVIYYVAGDTDLTEENKKIKCDVAFVPIGGTYTMTQEEAVKLVNRIKPKIAIPIHYGEIVGTKQDAKKFKEMLNSEIECKILIK